MQTLLSSSTRLSNCAVTMGSSGNPTKPWDLKISHGIVNVVELQRLYSCEACRIQVAVVAAVKVVDNVEDAIVAVDAAVIHMVGEIAKEVNDTN
jgi:hypothetical protein